MTNIYTEKLKLLTLNISDNSLIDSSKFEISVKNFFGGGAAYTKNKIFMTLTKVGLAVKLSEEDLVNIMSLGGRELRYFPNGHIKKQYALFPEEMIKQTKTLSFWIEKSILFVLGY